MGEHRLKAVEQNFLAIASGQRRVDPRLADRTYEAGDKVTFVRYDPAAKTEGAEVTVAVTHVAKFGRELFGPLSDDDLHHAEYALLGLSRPADAIVIPASGAIALKTWSDSFAAIEAGQRVDLRRRDRPFKLGSAILYQEFNPNNSQYTGRAVARQVKQRTPWKPIDFYTAEQLRAHGVAVLGWKGLEAKVE